MDGALTGLAVKYRFHWLAVITVITLLFPERWLNGQAMFECPPVIERERPAILRGPKIVLFDGSDLDQWVKRNGQPATNWIIQDGVLFRSQGGGDLYYRHWVQDFELLFEWKIAEQGNSGVKYRVQQYGNQMLGCEYQIQDDQNRPFNKHATGAIYAIQEPGKNKKTRPVGEWNQSRIVVCGNHIEHWLNGQLIVSTDIGGLDWLQRVSKSKFRDKPFFGQNREGRIFLQDHGNPVWYRRIELVPLDCYRWTATS